MQADVVIQSDDLVLGLSQRGSSFVVEIVGVGNDGVEAVITATQFEDDEYVILARPNGPRSLGHELGNDRAQRHQRRVFQSVRQELTTGEHRNTPKSRLQIFDYRSQSEI